jgi:hypothetical protein
MLSVRPLGRPVQYGDATASRVERETGVVDAPRRKVRLALRWSTKAPVHEK